ncbi:hypothetical protein PVAND_000912 [Polypedilum vanderplanki]|uniref:Uncharacterized protein n=1 Tax=Polypedilum vanderplanki TaxID=319348 RepID=A0A9J6BLR6_POLVA|nr:hypothetical protein PVAND_000912 [Polypedilum vanderplanki]
MKKHWISKDNFDVKGISFFDCVITKIPQGLKRTFPSLQFLQIYNSKLKVIEREDLKDYSSFLALHFGHNLIEFLPGDLLTNFRNLEVLSFSSNRIQIIGPNFLDGLSNLKFVSFRKNLCIDMSFDMIGSSGNATYLDIKDKIRELNGVKTEQPKTIDVKPINKNFSDVQTENEVLTFQNIELKVKCELLNDENANMAQEIKELKEKC